jgi:hypothetical protein
MKKMRKGKEKFTEDFFCVVLGRYRSGRVILYLTLLLINYTFLGKVLVGPFPSPPPHFSATKLDLSKLVLKNHLFVCAYIV